MVLEPELVVEDDVVDPVVVAVLLLREAKGPKLLSSAVSVGTRMAE